jgi:hypothetical protein
VTPRIEINIDCTDPGKLAEWYCEALGYAFEDAAGDQYRSITSPDGRPKIIFQRVPEAKAVKNRMHLDLIVGPGYEAEADRFERLGATRVEKVAEYGVNWIVMRDPEGNELCICDA